MGTNDSFNNPNDSDSDDDGLNDGDEVSTYHRLYSDN